MLEMDRLKFVWPSMELRPQALEYREEFLRSGETELHGAALFDQMDFEPWLELTVRNRRAETARSDWVQSSTFFVVREWDGRIIGMVEVRHRLNGFLSAFGGAMMTLRGKRGAAAPPLLGAAAFWVCVSLIGLLASDAPDLNGVLGLLTASALGGLLAAGLARREKGKRAKRHKTPRSRR